MPTSQPLFAGFEHACTTNYVQTDDAITLLDNSVPGVDIYSMPEALNLPEVAQYYGKAFDYLGRKYPQSPRSGCVVIVREGVKVEGPIQVCYYLNEEGGAQMPHNLYIAMPGSELNIVSACSSMSSTAGGSHCGQTEFLVMRGAKASYTMIHSWNAEVVVRPMSGAIVEEEGEFVSNYASFTPVKSTKMCPTAALVGRGAKASLNSIVYAREGSNQDLGGRILFQADGTSGEITSKIVSEGAEVIARGYLESELGQTRGHLECLGLKIGEAGYLQAIPELQAKTPQAELSHEASIGRLKQTELEYIMSRGIEEDRARSLLIRGFLSPELLKLPEYMQEELSELQERLMVGGF